MNNKRLLKKNTIPLAILATTIMLAGCGEGSDSDVVGPVKPGKEQTQFYAQDVVRQNSSSGMFYVDLSTNIGSDDDTKAALNQVTTLSADVDCRVVSQSHNGFTIKVSGAQVCDYRYRVGPALALMSTEIPDSSYAEATVRAVTGNHSDLLMPISAITSTGNSVSINIRDELGKVGYQLDEKFVLSNAVTLPLAYTTHSTAIVNPDENTIDYIPGAGISSGVERVLYSYTDAEGNVLAGAIDIAVSTESNHAPIAKSTKVTEVVDPETGEIRATVPWNKTIELDVASLISDPDGDELQLIDVFAYGATVTIPKDAIGDGNPLNSTVFQMHTVESGTKDISYTVSDLKGGYAAGVIEIEVDGPYADIGDFSAPHTAPQAAGFGAQFEPYGPGDGVTALNSVINASYDLERAEAVCATQGKYLPYESKLKDLYKEYSDQSIFKKKNWPINLPYWMEDGFVFDLGFGTTLSANDTEYRYVTCISKKKAEIISVEVDEKSKLEAPLLRGLKQEPKLKVTYDTGEIEIVDAQTITVQNPNVAEVTEGNGVVGINVGTTKIYIDLDGVVVDYALSVIDTDLIINGAALISVGETRQLNVSYKDDNSGQFVDIDNAYILSLTSDSPDIAKVKKKNDGIYYLAGVASGSTEIHAQVNLYNVIRSIESDVKVSPTDWCWKRAHSEIKNSPVCLGYDQSVTQAPGIMEFVTEWGNTSRNPYVKSEYLNDFCAAFNSTPFEHFVENTWLEIITVDEGSIDEISSVADWLVVSNGGILRTFGHEGWKGGQYPSSPEITTVKFTSNIHLSDGTGVPLCILSNSGNSEIQARILLD